MLSDHVGPKILQKGGVPVLGIPLNLYNKFGAIVTKHLQRKSI